MKKSGTMVLRMSGISRSGVGRKREERGAAAIMVIEDSFLVVR